MKSIAFILALFLISLPAWALKPMEDHALSTVSGPDSLSVTPLPSARLVIRLPERGEGNKGIAKMLLRDMWEMSREILFGDEGFQGAHGRDPLQSRLAFSAGARKYREGYISTEEIESDRAYGKDDPVVSAYTKNDAYYSLETPLGKRHSIDYVFGSYNSSDEAVFWVNRPYGGPEMRSHYLKNSSTAVQPNSWVDVKPR